MKVSLSWLSEHVSLDLSDDLSETEIADALTMAGLEVDGVEDRFAWLGQVVAGKITSIRPHPDADRLRVCEVDAGQDRLLTIVCGAPNAAENMVTALVLPGTELPGGVIKKGKIRGVKSEGMLASAKELGLDTDASGIMTLDPATEPGCPLTKALSLSDPVFEIDLTPNRPDCLSIIGVAREVAAFSNSTVSLPDIIIEESDDDITALTSVTIEEPKLCPRYAARVVLDIKVGQSPSWLQDRLLSVGLKPINTIVDVTNFVMMETGQPLHAFDLDRLAENRIVVRCAGQTKTFTTLDDKERALSPDMLMICDGKKPVAVAGVMGGQNSEINDATTRVLIESACFYPASVRKTAKLLTLSSDAAHRFERGVDPLGTVTAVNRAAQLMADLSGGRIAKGVIDNHPRPPAEKNIILSVAATNRRLGTSLDAEAIAGYLKAVAFTPTIIDEDSLKVHVPSFRVDVERPEDLAEEVARLWGYNNIPVTFPTVSANIGKPATAFILRNRVRDLMAGFGYSEVVNYSFISREACDSVSADLGEPVEVLNPLNVEQAVMRMSLIPGLLMSMQHNLSQQQKDLRLFEVGRVFWPRADAEQPYEPDLLAGLITGARDGQSWLYAQAACDFYDIKGAVESLLAGLNVSNVTFSAMPEDQCTYTIPGLTAQIEVDGQAVGRIGAIATPVLKAFNLKQPAFVFEINFSTLSTYLQENREAAAISRFPAVFRDITVIVDKTIEAGGIVNFLANERADLIEDVQVVNVYDGAPVPSGKKSVSARVTYRSQDSTLKDKFVNKVHDELAARLLKEFDAELPG